MRERDSLLWSLWMNIRLTNEEREGKKFFVGREQWAEREGLLVVFVWQDTKSSLREREETKIDRESTRKESVSWYLCPLVVKSFLSVIFFLVLMMSLPSPCHKCMSPPKMRWEEIPCDKIPYSLHISAIIKRSRLLVYLISFFSFTCFLTMCPCPSRIALMSCPLVSGLNNSF